MKRTLLFAVALFAFSVTSMAQNPYLDFSAVCPSGQTLYYSTTYVGPRLGVSVTWPNYENGDYYAGYEKPTGRIVIPDTVYWHYEDSFTDTVYVCPVYSIGQNCFNGCTGITSVVVPHTVIAFEPSAFAGCSSLDSIFMPAVPPRVYAGQPIGMSVDANFYIPCGTWQAYYDTGYYYIHSGMGHPECLEPEAEGVSLTLLVDDEERGEAAFHTPGVIDYVRCDSVAMIHAIPAYHYEFDHWSNGSTKIADTLFITSDSTLTAYFVIGHHTVQAVAYTSGTGTVEGGGTFLYLDTIILKAIPSEGYHFVRWNDNNTENPRTVVVDQDYFFYAVFAEGDPEGIDDVENSHMRVYVEGGRIVVEDADAEDVRVYSADGKQVANGHLRPGVYLVQVGAAPAVKVMVAK